MEPERSTQSTRSALSHSVTCNRHLLQLHKDLFGPTATMWWGQCPGRDERCVILWTLRNDCNQRKPVGLLRGHPLHGDIGQDFNHWNSPSTIPPFFHRFFNLELIQMISSCFMSCHMTFQDDGGASPRPGHPTWPWRTSTQHLPVSVAKGWEGFGRVFRCLRPNDIGQWNLEVDELMSWCSFHNSFHHHFMLGKLWFQRCSPRSAVRSPPRIHMLIQEAERFSRATQVTRIAASRVLRLSRRTNSRCPISMRRPKLQTSNITFAILQDLNVSQDERYHEETSQFFTYIDTSLMLQYDTIYSMI